MEKSILIFGIALLSATSIFAQQSNIKKDLKMYTQLRDDIYEKDPLDLNNFLIIDNLYNSFATGDIPAVLSGMDPQIVWNEAESNAYSDGNPYIGPDAVLTGVFVQVWAEHEYFALRDIQLHKIGNNKIMATLRYDGKVRQTGKTYDAQAVHVWTLKNGKIVEFQQYADTKKINDAFSVPNYTMPTSKLFGLESLSSEIKFLLKSSNDKIAGKEVVTVFFSITKDRKMQQVKVATKDEAHSNLLEKKLEGRQLDGHKWREGIIYELSVGLLP